MSCLWSALLVHLTLFDFSEDDEVPYVRFFSCWSDNEHPSFLTTSEVLLTLWHPNVWGNKFSQEGTAVSPGEMPEKVPQKITDRHSNCYFQNMHLYDQSRVKCSCSGG